MLSRRELIGKVAAGAAVATAVAATAGVAHASVTAVRGKPLVAPPGPGPEGAAVLGPMPESASEVADAAVSAQPGPAEAVLAPPPWELVRPLTPGAPVGHGWRVVELSSVDQGSCVLTLGNARGRTARIHLCRNAGQPQGLVYTERVDLLVMNGGQQELPTEEGLAQAVAAVAHVVAANETGWHEAAVVGTLLPHRERLEQFAAEARLR